MLNITIGRYDMATRYDVILPSGEKRPIFYNETQSKKQIVEEV